MSADAGRGQKRPTGLIVLCVVLGLAVVGLLLWGFSAQSDADDAEAKLKDQQQASASATAQPSPSSASGSSEDTQAAFDQIASELGVSNETIDDIQQDLAAAKQKVDDAQAQRAQASGVAGTAKADLEVFKAQVEQARKCLKGSLDALGAAVEDGDVDAAVERLQQLAGSCESAASP